MPATIDIEKDLKENNAAVIQALADQDINGKSTAPNAKNDTTDSALDDMLTKRLEAKQAAEPEAKEGAEPEKKDEPKAKEGADPAKQAEPEKKDAPEKKTEPAAKEGTDPAKQAAPDEKAEAEKKAQDLFAGIELPPQSKPKSAEAFSAVKSKAAQEIVARDTTIAELRKTLTELEAKANQPIPKEIDAELKELREFRAKLDVEADPQFKEYDRKADSAREFIYAKLKQSGKVGDEAIAKIKEFGGPEKVNMEKIFAGLADPSLQRVIEAKLTEIEMTSFEKDKAKESVKERVSEYIKEREEFSTKATTEHRELTKKTVNDLLGKLTWAVEKPVEGDEAAKKQAAAHNEFVKGVRNEIDTAIQDDSPEMRAILLTGMAQLFNYQRIAEAQSQRIAAQDKELTEARAQLDKLKNASVSRLRESGAPPGGGSLAKKPISDFNKPAVSALDEAAQSVLEARAARGEG